MPLDVDPNNPPDDVTDYSIPPGSVAEIRVSAVSSANGQVPVLYVLDDDSHEALRGADDLLDERPIFFVGAGMPFELSLYIDCTAGPNEIGGFEQSGEQSAEVYVRDGAIRIPADRDLGGGRQQKSWWKIDCDKQTSLTLGPQGGQIDAPWGDSLHVPPGALSADTQIRMANMFPLAHVENVPPGSLSISEAQALEPDGLALEVPALLVFKYTQEEVGENADESTLAVYRYDAGSTQWLPLHGASVDPEQDLLSVPIAALGTYGFAAARPPALPALPLAGLALGALAIAAGAARLRSGRPPR